MSNKLLAKKSSLISRRNIVIYMVTIILILGIVAGFTNTFNSDNRKFTTKWGETIVMESAPPKGGTPDDYDMLDNLRFAAYNLHHAKSFRGETKGRVDADIGIGNYTQYLTNTRVVYDQNTVFTETISSSSLVSLAEQKYADNGVIIYRPSEKINGNKATYSSKAIQMSYDDYSKKYGSVPNQLSKYIIDENTILSVKDENASKMGARNSNGDDVKIELTDKPVPDKDGNYKFTLTLDPTQSSLYYRNEVRTLAGADQNPIFYSVKITITIDKNWYPISTRTVETYDIAIPVLGSMRCVGDNLEEFSMIDDENIKIPEKDFFQPYVDKAMADPDFTPPDIINTRPPSASDYLAAAFAGYISGEKNLDLTVNVEAGSIAARKLNLSVNLDTLDVKAMLGKDFYVGYSGDKVYLNVNDVNGYLTTDAAKQLMGDELIGNLIASFGSLGDIDINAMFGGDMLGTIFGNTEMTTENGVTTIPMSFPLDLSAVAPDLNVQVDAAILINDADKSLLSITGDVTVNGTVVKITAKPLSTPPAFPSTDGAVSLDGMLDFVPSILSTAMQKTYRLNGTVSLDGMDVNVSAYIDRTDGIAAEAHIGLFGADVTVKYVGDYIYVTVGGINARGTIDELPELLDVLLEVTGMSKYIPIIKGLLPTTVNDYAKMLDSMTVTDTELNVGLKFINIPIGLKLTRADGKLSNLGLSVNVDMFGIKADVAADLDISCPERYAVQAPVADEFTSFAQIAEMIKSAEPYLNSENNLTVGIDGKLTVDGVEYDVNGAFDVDKVLDKSKSIVGVNAKGNLSALGVQIDVTYADGVAYVAVGNIKAKLDPANADSLVDSVMQIIKNLVGTDGLDDIDMTEVLPAALDGLYIDANGIVGFNADVAGGTVSAAIDIKTGVVRIVADIPACKADVTVTISAVKANRHIAAPANSAEYIDVNELSPAVDAAAKIIEQRKLAATAEVTLNGKTYSAFIEADFGGDVIKARITERTLPLEAVIIGDAVFVSAGEIKLHGDINDMQALYAALQAEFGLPAIDGLIGTLPSVKDIPTLLTTALDSVKSLTLDNGVLGMTVIADGYVIDVAAATDLSEMSVKTNLDGTDVKATVKLGGVCGEITAPDGEFTQVSEFTAIVPTIATLANSGAFDVAYDATVTGSEVYTADGTAALSLTDGVAAIASVNMFGQRLNVTYTENTVYLDVAGLKFGIATSDVAGLLPKLSRLAAALDLGVDLPESIDSGMLDSLLASLDVESLARTALGSVKSFGVKDGVITLTVEYDGHAVALEISAAGNDINVIISATVFGMDISLDLALIPSDSKVAAPTDTTAYSDVAMLGDAIDAATAILEVGAVSATADIAVGDITLSAAIEAELKDGLKARVTENTLGLELILLGDTAYISLGDINISGELADITEIMNVVMPNLPDEIRVYMEKMTEQLIGMVPSKSDVVVGGKTDIEKTLDLVLGIITELSIANDKITLALSNHGLSAVLGIATDLSGINGNVTMSFVNIGGPFGENFDVSAGFNLNGLTATAAHIPVVDPDQYVKACTITDIMRNVMPLVKEKAFDISVAVTVYDQTVTGNIYVDLGDYTLDSIAVEAVFNVAGTTVAVMLANKTLYLDINDDSIRISQSLEKGAIKSLIAQLDEALPELGIADKLNELTSDPTGKIDLADILGKIAVSPTETGMRITAFGVTAELDVIGGALSALRIDCNTDALDFAASMAVTTENGVIAGISAQSIGIADTTLSFAVGISPVAQRTVSVAAADYVSPAEFIPFIAPVKALATDATTAKTITVDIADMTVNIMNKQLKIDGKISISLDPIAVKADIVLFADSETDKLDLAVTYVDGVVYVTIGKIALKFDTASDVQAVYKAIEKHLPKSLKNIGDLSAFTTVSALLKNIQSIIDAPDTATIVNVMFDDTNAYGKSMIKQVADMLHLFKRDDRITVGVTVMEIPFDVTLNVAPVINGEFLDIALDTAIGNILSLGLTAKPYFSDEPLNGLQPDSTQTCVSLADFVTAVVNAVNTLTARADDDITTDDDGNTTTVSQTAFEIDTFKFDYDIFKPQTTKDADGNTVEVVDEETGRTVIATDELGNKIIDKTIQISNNGQTALKFGLTRTTVTDANDDVISTKSQIFIEAHLKVGILTAPDTYQTGFPIELDLYVAPTDDCPDGLAYLYYREANGYGEKISIDYTSIMQIVAAVMDIVGADDDTIDELLKDYRLPIDTTVFDSMAISGFDTISKLLDNAVRALNNVKTALNSAKSAWARLQDAEDIEALIREMLNETTDDGTLTIKSHLDNAISNVKDAIALFVPDDEEEEVEQPEATEINGALVGKVVNSIYFRSANSKLSAYVDNNVATGTEGWASVSVTSQNNKINNIGVNNLDVNTAKLNTFDMQFAATQNVTVAIPEDYKDGGSDGEYKLRHADLANIKHLLFDVMNTANLFEFEIGGLNTSDVINIKLNLDSILGSVLGEAVKLDLNIHYDVKVKIIQTGVDKNGKAQYSTAAVVELMFKNCKAKVLNIDTVVIKDCTTRLYFYDDVLYVQGVRDQSNNTQKRAIGNLTEIKYDRKNAALKPQPTEYMTIQHAEEHQANTSYMEYVNVMYTVDEFFWMIKNDMSTFLKEFLFYLVPLSTKFTAFNIDLQDTIVKQFSGNDTSETTVNTANTIAQIFKEYTYNGSKHSLRLGLKELAGSDALSDLVVDITGVNDNDDDGINGNIANNYISDLRVYTDIKDKLIEVTLNATLNNVNDDTENDDIESKGFAPTDVTRLNGGYSVNGNNYVLDADNYDRNTLYTIDGGTYFTQDGTLYTDYGTFAPTLRFTNSSDIVTTTSSSCDNKLSTEGYKVGHMYWQYTYTFELYGYCYEDTADVYYVGADADGAKYLYRVDGNGNRIRITVKSIVGDLLAKVTRDAKGKVASVENRTGGVQWSRPWQAKYDAAQAA